MITLIIASVSLSVLYRRLHACVEEVQAVIIFLEIMAKRECPVEGSPFFTFWVRMLRTGESELETIVETIHAVEKSKDGVLESTEFLRIFFYKIFFFVSLGCILKSSYLLFSGFSPRQLFFLNTEDLLTQCVMGWLFIYGGWILVDFLSRRATLGTDAWLDVLSGIFFDARVHHDHHDESPRSNGLHGLVDTRRLLALNHAEMNTGRDLRRLRRLTYLNSLRQFDRVLKNRLQMLYQWAPLAEVVLGSLVLFTSLAPLLPFWV